MKPSLHTLLSSSNQQYLFIGFITNNILDAIAAGIERGYFGKTRNGWPLSICFHNLCGDVAKYSILL